MNVQGSQSCIIRARRPCTRTQHLPARPQPALRRPCSSRAHGDSRRWATTAPSGRRPRLKGARPPMALKAYAASGVSIALGSLEALYSSLKGHRFSASGIRAGILGKHAQAPHQPQAAGTDAEVFWVACLVACRSPGMDAPKAALSAAVAVAIRPQPLDGMCNASPSGLWL